MKHPTLQAGPGRPRTNLTAQLSSELVNAIHKGQYAPGARLPSERELGEQYGVSRTVVREAISSLRAAGLVQSLQGKGAFVLKSARVDGFRIDAAELETVREVIQMLELRIGVEAEAAALAAQRHNVRAIREIARCHAAMQFAVERGDDAINEDMQFHKAVMQATGNRYFIEFFDYLGGVLIPRARVDRFGGSSARRQQYLRKVNLEHHALLDAIKAGNPEAARRAVNDHLGRSRDRLRLSLSH